MASNLESLVDEVVQLSPWFHNLHLPDGRQTAPDHPLGDFPRETWEHIAPHLPDDLSGWRVLDIGCNAGFYTFELARRGATVTAIDHDPHYLNQATWAARQLGMTNISFRQMQVYDLAREEERYDLVWFMGVNYHLRYPLLGLDIVTRKVERLMVYQTMTMPGDDIVSTPDDFPLNERQRMTEPGWPVMAFIEGRLANDPTNWWAANRACVEAMLRSCQMRIARQILPEVYLCEPEPEATRETNELLEAEYRVVTGLG